MEARGRRDVGRARVDVTMFTRVGSLLRNLFARERKQRALADELDSYVDLVSDEYARDGLSADEARRRALSEANVEHTKEITRDAWIGTWIAVAIRDLAYSWRSLRRTPAFTIAVSLTLAIGIGANAAVMSVMDTMFLRKLPVPHPESVFQIYLGDTREGRRSARDPASFPDYDDLRTRLSGISGLAAYAMTGLPLGDEFAGSSAWSALVTASYFPLFGVTPARGRFIGAGEDQGVGAHPVAVISYTMWQSRFNGDNNVVGRVLTIGTGRFTIIGVAPAGFTGTHPEGRTDIWIPYTMQAEATGRDYTFGNRAVRHAVIVGRLAEGSSIERVQQSAERALHDLSSIYPSTDASLRIRVAKHDRLFTVDQNPSAPFDFLFVWAMIALLHLVACMNIASLMLARAAARRRELGVRLCLGASRIRIIAQSLGEPALLGLIGAAGGLAIARWLTSLVTSLRFLSAGDPGLDVRVVAIVAAVTIGTVIQFGLLPAKDAARRDPLVLLRGGTTRAAGTRDRTGPVLVCAQVALSLILVSNAAALVRMYQRESRSDLGFDAARVALADVHWRRGYHPGSDWNTTADALTRGLVRSPGVRAVALASVAPLRPQGGFAVVKVEGHAYAIGENTTLSTALVSPGYFSAIGASLARGRAFTPTDRMSATDSSRGFDVAIVNEAFAHRYWPGEDALGKRISYAGHGTSTIVGVIHDMHDVTIAYVQPRAYFPLLEASIPLDLVVIASVQDDPYHALGELREAVMTSALPIDPPSLSAMASVVDDALALSRVGGAAVSSCAGIALLLTCIGLYGLVASWGAERRREIGIRLALGAQRVQVHGLLLRGTALPVGIGLMLGGAGTVALLVLERAWWGPAIGAGTAPLVIGGAVLAAIAGIAALVPAWRSAGVDPSEALRVA